MKENKWVEVFGHKEWEFIVRHGSSIRDPEEKKVFWETIKAKKEADPYYSVFTDFPQDLRERKVFPGHQICSEILDTLKVHKRGESA